MFWQWWFQVQKSHKQQQQQTVMTDKQIGRYNDII